MAQDSKVYVYREHKTGQRIESDKPLSVSPSGHDVTEIEVRTVPAPKPVATAPAKP